MATAMGRKRLAWSPPSAADPEAIAHDYVKRVSTEPTVIGVWADTENLTLHLYTLMGGDGEAERRVHDTELEIRTAWPGVAFRFTVLKDGDWLPPETSLDRAIYLHKQ